MIYDGEIMYSDLEVVVVVVGGRGGSVGGGVKVWGGGWKWGGGIDQETFRRYKAGNKACTCMWSTVDSFWVDTTIRNTF